MRFFTAIIFTFFLWGTSYAEMVTVSADSATLRSLPSVEGSYAVLNVPLYYPLNLLETSNDFYRVADFLGRTGWIHKNEVTEEKGVVVKPYSINVRQGPGLNHEVIFMARQGVTFKVLKEQDGWLEVIHENGKKGWVSKRIVWGF